MDLMSICSPLSGLFLLFQGTSLIFLRSCPILDKKLLFIPDLLSFGLKQVFSTLLEQTTYLEHFWCIAVYFKIPLKVLATQISKIWEAMFKRLVRTYNLSAFHSCNSRTTFNAPTNCDTTNEHSKIIHQNHWKPKW